MIDWLAAEISGAGLATTAIDGSAGGNGVGSVRSGGFPCGRLQADFISRGTTVNREVLEGREGTGFF
ncbi:hypothetical protein HSX37_07740|uniref:hypothetical protein n=1 Tax=Dendrosporobacter quercicolus TaxID=146817 RepID=UPI001570A42A|nr:hypothetical protein [Dendrosporobacter quercicolus]NSL47932.1 hypothetical protein [Dendrosporobacter quercicolus DSM 1736]